MCTAWYHRAKWKKTFSIHFPMYGWSLSTRIGITLPKHIKAHLSQFVCCSMLKQNSYWVIFTAPHIINTYRKIWFVIRQWFGSSDKYGFDLFPLLFSFLSLSLSSSHLSYDIAQIRRTLIKPFAIVTFPMDFLLYVLSHPDGLLLFCDCLRHVAHNVPHFVRIKYEWYASHSVLSLSHTLWLYLSIRKISHNSGLKLIDGKHHAWLHAHQFNSAKSFTAHTEQQQQFWRLVTPIIESKSIWRLIHKMHIKHTLFGLHEKFQRSRILFASTHRIARGCVFIAKKFRVLESTFSTGRSR